MIVQGDWLEARELATVTQAQGSPLERHMAVTTLGTLARHQGDTDLAWEMVRELLPRGPASEPGDALFPYAIETLRLAVSLAFDASNTGEARDWLETHDHWLSWSKAVRGQAESKLLRAQLHQIDGDLEHSGRLAREALELATEPRQPLVLLAIYRFLGRLAKNAKRYDEAEDHLTQALELAESCAAPYERACTLLELADLYLLNGRENEAQPLLDDVRDTAAGLEAAPLTAAVEDLEARLESSTSKTALTARETEVLRLVIEGITDAEVAEQLHISPRTVGQHLRSIYNKLGVSSRTAATRRAVEDGLV
ncbi:hypothetical protein BH23CHL2_BH23CHL2_20890 [soil metagenome]